MKFFTFRGKVRQENKEQQNGDVERTPSPRKSSKHRVHGHKRRSTAPLASHPKLNIEPDYLLYPPPHTGRCIENTIFVYNTSSETCVYKLRSQHPKRYFARPSVALVGPASATRVRIVLIASESDPLPPSMEDWFRVSIKMVPTRLLARGASGTVPGAREVWNELEAEPVQHEKEIPCYFRADMPPPSQGLVLYLPSDHLRQYQGMREEIHALSPHRPDSTPTTRSAPLSFEATPIPAAADLRNGGGQSPSITLSDLSPSSTVSSSALSSALKPSVSSSTTSAPQRRVNISLPPGAEEGTGSTTNSGGRTFSAKSRQRLTSRQYGRWLFRFAVLCLLMAYAFGVWLHMRQQSEQEGGSPHEGMQQFMDMLCSFLSSVWVWCTTTATTVTTVLQDMTKRD